MRRDTFQEEAIACVKAVSRKKLGVRCILRKAVCPECGE